MTALSLAVVNPFEYTACVPDGAKNAGCFTTKQYFTIGTGAAGSCCGLAFQPDVNNTATQDTASVAATPTFPAGNSWTQAFAIASIQSLYSSSRAVACGMKVRYIGNTTTDAGICVIGQVDHSVPLSSFNATTVTTATALFLDYKIFPVREGADIYLTPPDIEQMDQFISNATTNNHTLATANRQDYLLVLVYGANASQNIFGVECIAQYEGTFALQTLTTGKNSAAADAVPGWYEKLQNSIKYVEPIVSGIKTLGSMANGLKSAGLLDSAPKANAGGLPYYGANLPIDY